MRRGGNNRGRKESGPRVNGEITASEVRLIGEQGGAFGVVSLREARAKAEEVGLDLVEVSPTAKPPVVKLIDFGKYKYQQQKKAAEAKKKQVTIQVKEIKFRPNIERHDLDVKLKNARRFLEQGDKIKLLMQFRGREMAHFQMGFEKFKGILGEISELGAVVESEPKPMGNRIIAMVSPSKSSK